MRTDDFFADLATQLREADARTGTVPVLARLPRLDWRLAMPVVATAAILAAVLIVAVGSGPHEQALAAPRTVDAHVREAIHFRGSACQRSANMTRAAAPATGLDNLTHKDNTLTINPATPLPMASWDPQAATGLPDDFAWPLSNLVATKQLAEVCGRGWGLSGPGVCLYGGYQKGAGDYTLNSACATLTEVRRGSVVLKAGSTLWAFAPPGRVGQAGLTAHGRTYTPETVNGSVVQFSVPRLTKGDRVTVTFRDERSQAFAVIDERTSPGGFSAAQLWNHGFPESQGGLTFSTGTPGGRAKTLVLGRSQADAATAARMRKVMGLPPAPFAEMSDDQRAEVSPDANILILAGDDYDPS